MQRAIDLRGAVAINVITMIGIGPLVTIPLVIAALGGPLALVGLDRRRARRALRRPGLGGALLAVPGSGGTYVYLRDVFGRAALGRALAFLFNWQFLLYAPCLLASGYIGFANYAAISIRRSARTPSRTTPSPSASARLTIVAALSPHVAGRVGRHAARRRRRR